MKGLHQLLLQAIKDHARPSRQLSRIIAAKLEEQGIENATQYLDQIESQIQTILNSSTPSDLHSFSIQTGNAEVDGRHMQISLVSSDIDRMIEQTSRAIHQSLPSAADDVAKFLLRRIKHDAREGFEAQNFERAAFESRLWDRWGRALGLLELEIALAREAGQRANGWLRKHRRKSDSLVVGVLTLLHARACQVAGEIETLLLSGYADGAMARWRTLHELSVVSWFIKDRGNAVAERYLLHTDIDSLRAARQYNQFAPIIGYKGLSQRELATLERKEQRLVQRFGKPFREEYGWAASTLGNRNPRFSDIEKTVGLDGLRPFYKLASHNVHAGPKGATFRLGLLRTTKSLLLAGPSNAGLGEAGRLAAISLSQITISLLLLRTTFDSLVWSKVLLNLSKEVEKAFTKTERQLEREERALVKQGRTRQKTDDALLHKRRRKPA